MRDSEPFDELFWKSSAFRNLVKAYDEQGGWAALISHISLQGELALVRQNSQKVQIMTIHAAKGLEFRAVFVPALEECLMPFTGTAVLFGQTDKESYCDEDEERRLLYVAMTRASEGLYLSQAKKRIIYGQEVSLPQSRFLAPLLKDGMKSDEEFFVKRSALVEHQTRKTKQLTLLG